MSAFWFGVQAGFAMPFLWVFRIGLWVGVVVCSLLVALGTAARHGGLWCMSWDDRIEETLARKWSRS